MASIDVLISVNRDSIDCMTEFVENLRSAGLKNINILESIGIVTGSVEEDKITELSMVSGVEKVERSQESQIPPPDAPIQ